MDRVTRIWYLSPMRAAKVQASLRGCAGSPEPSLLAHTSSESRGTFRQKARSLAPLNGWACAVKFCHDGMLEDTNSLDGAHIKQLKKKLSRPENIFPPPHKYQMVSPWLKQGLLFHCKTHRNYSCFLFVRSSVPVYTRVVWCSGRILDLVHFAIRVIHLSNDPDYLLQSHLFTTELQFI